MFDDKTFDDRNNSPAAARDDGSVAVAAAADPAIELFRRWRQKSDELDAARAALDAIKTGLLPELKAAATEGVWMYNQARNRRIACIPGPWIDDPEEMAARRRHADSYGVPADKFEKFIAELRSKGAELERCGFTAAKAKHDALHDEWCDLSDEIETVRATTLPGFVGQLLVLRDDPENVDKDVMQMILDGVYRWCSSDDIVAPGDAPAASTAVTSAPEAGGSDDDEVEAILAAAAAERDALAGVSVLSGLSLAELIAAAHRAWAADSPVRSKADKLCFAWRDADPDQRLSRARIKEEDRPEPMGKLYRMANRLVEIANNLTDRVVTWVPENLADAIRLIEFDVDRLEAEKIYDGLLTGLRAIASRGNIEDTASLPEAPVVVMFRDWLAAERHAAELGMNAPDDDPEFEDACEKANDILDRIYATPATDLPSLAVKAHLRLYEEHSGKRGVEIGKVNFEVIGGFEGATDAELALARDLSRICPELPSATAVPPANACAAAPDGKLRGRGGQPMTASSLTAPARLSHIGRARTGYVVSRNQFSLPKFGK